jgi:hypothetical protein
MKINDVVFEAAAMIPTAAPKTPVPGAATAAPAATGVAQAVPGAIKPKVAGFPVRKTPEQIKQIQQAKQAAATQTAPVQQPVATATQPAATQPAQQQPTATAPTTPVAPYDPVTGKGAKYDGVTGEATPGWQAELDKQEAARLEKVEANRIASQAAAAERDVRNAELVQQGARQNPSNVTNNITQTSATPNASVVTTDPAQVTAAMQAKINAMKQKNPKLAAQMAQTGMDDMFNDELNAAGQPGVTQAPPVAEDVQRMIQLAGITK